MKFAVLLFFALILEGTLTLLPIVFLILLFFAVSNKNQFIFPLAFISGTFLDLFSLRIIGTTSIFFLIFFFLIFLYERKFEIKSPWFFAIAGVFGSTLYFILL